MRHFICTVAVSAFLVSCTQIEDLSNNEETENLKYGISFINKDNSEFTMTRATQKAASDIKSYGVSCSYYPNTESYTTAECGSYFYNLTIDAASGKSGYYWPGRDYKLSFYAYTPCDNSNISLVSSKDYDGIPQYRYNIPESVMDQVDFMTCNVLDHEGISTTPIPLTFNHRCSDIRFSVHNISASDLKLKSINIIGAKYQGILSNDSWTLDGNANSLTEHPFLYSPDITVKKDSTIDVTGKDGHFIIIPQTVPKETTFIVFLTEEQGEQHTYNYILSNDMVLAESKSYQLKFNIGYNTLTVESVSIIPWTDVVSSGNMELYESESSDN